MTPRSRISKALRLKPQPTWAIAFVVAATSWTGCGGGGAAVFPTGEYGSRPPRKPDGVVIDPESEPPAARDRAPVDEGMVTLRAPLGPEIAVATVRELFRRVVARDMENLSELFTPTAQALSSTPGAYGMPDKAWDFWIQRGKRLDYTKLAGEVLFREVDIEIYRADSAESASPNPLIRVDALDETDLILSVTMLAGTSGLDRYFGDTILFWLRRQGDAYKIYREVEEFQIQ